MAFPIEDDDLFSNALSSSQRAFWVMHPHLAEHERQQLWNRRLSRYLFPPDTNDADLALCDNGDNNSSYRCNGGISESLGKRSRDDVARTMPGLPAQKRRTTVGVHLPGSMFSPTLPLLVPVQD